LQRDRGGDGGTSSQGSGVNLTTRRWRAGEPAVLEFTRHGRRRAAAGNLPLETRISEQARVRLRGPRNWRILKAATPYRWGVPALSPGCICLTRRSNSRMGYGSDQKLFGFNRSPQTGERGVYRWEPSGGLGEAYRTVALFANLRRAWVMC
jgi:hypothetical protein